MTWQKSAPLLPLYARASVHLARTALFVLSRLKRMIFPGVFLMLGSELRKKLNKTHTHDDSTEIYHKDLKEDEFFIAAEDFREDEME